MITSDAGRFLERLARLEADPQRAVPEGVMVVLPNDFYVEHESAADNVYVDTQTLAEPARAARQAADLVRLIEQAGVPVHAFPGRPDQPDGVFSNNVFATAPGRAVVGAMYHPTRQQEGEHEGIRRWLEHDSGRDLIELDRKACIAEMTGPLVIDRARNVGFCGMSQRVDAAGARAMHAALGLELTWCFDLDPGEYHSNVVLSILAGRACVAVPDAFPDPTVMAVLETAFPDRCLALSKDEKNAFAANCIALSDKDLFMSDRARQALSEASRSTLSAWNFTIHSTDLSEFELAGGSLRCMVTELF